MNINKEIEYIHKVLGTRHSFFTETAEKGVKLRLEDDICCKYSFIGMTMVTALNEALAYIKQEVKAGSLKDTSVDETDIVYIEDVEENQEETIQSDFSNKLKKDKKHGKNK